MPTSPPVSHGDAGDQIFGRERELARLDELVDAVSEHGAALLVRGEAGIGKTTLLTAACRRAEDAGMRVLRTTGVQSEAQLPFAGLHQLVLPVLGQAPTPQRAALLAAFGMEEAPEPPDRFLIALAVLELLSEAAEHAPLLVVAEDAHWLDRSTADVLAFVARRVEHEPLVVLVASRDGEESFLDEAGLPELRLGGLDDAAAESLLDAHGRRLVPTVRQQLREQTGGNPLALVELPVLLGTDELGGRSRLPTPLPLTARLERAFGTRVGSIPPRTRSLLLLAAVDHGGDLEEILAAAAVIDGGEPTVEDFAPALAARLVRVDGTSIAFRHPLVRSAVYQTASLGERRAAHAAVAEMLADQPDRQAWHRAAALVGPDAGSQSEARRNPERPATANGFLGLRHAIGRYGLALPPVLVRGLGRRPDDRPCPTTRNGAEDRGDDRRVRRREPRGRLYALLSTLRQAHRAGSPGNDKLTLEFMPAPPSPRTEPAPAGSLASRADPDSPG